MSEHSRSNSDSICYDSVMVFPDRCPHLAVLGLESFASGDTIRRRASECLARARLVGGDGAECALIARAAERLANPIERLHDGLRWFALANGSVKHAIETGRTWKGALDLLERAIERELNADASAHNRIVLAVMRALGSEGTHAAKLAISEVSRQASSLNLSAAFWASVQSQVQIAQDPRLTNAAVGTARAQYIEIMLTSILTPLGIDVAKRDANDVRDVLTALQGARFPEATTSAATKVVLGSFVGNFEYAIEQCLIDAKRANTKPLLIACTHAIHERLDRDSAFLAKLSEVAGTDARRVCDAYASLLRTLAVRSGNEFRMFADAERLLLRAQVSATSSTLRAQIAEDLQNVIESKAFAHCSFCTTREADGEPYEQALYKVTERLANSVLYSQIKINAPRCKHCAQRHGTQGNVMLGIAAAFAIAVLIVGGIIIAEERAAGFCSICGLLAGAVIGGFIFMATLGTIVGFFVRMPLKNFKPVAKLLNEGWSYGDKPGKHG